ncbi:MAG: CCA tRNA nucleotidyltransferase, partial [Candidatus Roizmanbacteria bacterium]
MNRQIILPDHCRVFMDVFRTAGYQIYLVGGSVRDLLLKKDSTNWDLTTNATPQNIQKLFDHSIYENTYGTVTIIQKEGDTEMLYEVTPYRKETGYQDFRHPEKIIWADSIQEDLKRRDFTINAMAYDGTELIDTEGGIQDLENKMIKAVGDAQMRFGEDALRLMRAVRFACQLDFSIEDKTKEAIKKLSALLVHVSGERIRDEFLKILASDSPDGGVLLLKELGLLDHILPELVRCFDTPQVSPGRH